MDDVTGSGATGSTGAGHVPIDPGKLADCERASPLFSAIHARGAGRLRARAAAAIRDRAYGDDSLRRAEKLLLAAVRIDAEDRAGKTRHLLGLTYFHLGYWEQAKEHLTLAAERDPLNAEARALLARAEVNAATLVDRPVPPTAPFTAADLLRPPLLALIEPQDIAPLLPAPKRGVFALLGCGLGLVFGALLDGAVHVLHALRRRDVLFAFESWDRRGLLRGELELAGIRRSLSGDKLQSTYDGLVGHQQPGQRRPAWTERFRTATGAWTTDDPMEGAAGTEIQRTGTPAHPRRDRVEDPDLPSPREVSRQLLASRGAREIAPFLNLLTIAWLQPQLHDWISHRPGVREGAYTVKLAGDDPLRASHGIGALHVPRSASNPLAQAGRLAYLNESTHWWDASHLYGSDQATQDRLRGGRGAFCADGKLRMDGALLPLDPASGIEDTGMARNWWIGPALFHTLFVKHHNFICDVLKQAYPAWSTDQLFHTARLVNAAILAKIHTVEWTPAVLPNKKVVTGMAANWWGLLEALLRRASRRRIRRWYEPVHPVLGGLAGGRRSNHGKPYGMSEEFSEIYRFHAALPDAIALMPLGSAQPAANVPIDRTRGAMVRRLLEDHGMATLLHSLGHQRMPALVHNNYPSFAAAMSVEGHAVVDLGAIDILRARERGVPPYNEFRRMLDLKPIAQFDELGCDGDTVARLEQLYGRGADGVEKMDLLVGTSCELRRPQNFAFGETMFTVFIQMASRRLQADPFYTDKLNARYYTEEGMQLLERATLKDILLQHYPELAATGLARVGNPFEPWGTSAATFPAEHPLAGLERY